MSLECFEASLSFMGTLFLFYFSYKTIFHPLLSNLKKNLLIQQIWPGQFLYKSDHQNIYYNNRLFLEYECYNIVLLR